VDETQSEPHRTMDEQTGPERELPTGDEARDAEPAAPTEDEDATEPEPGQ
jgi:hypothetical protein